MINGKFKLNIINTVVVLFAFLMLFIYCRSGKNKTLWQQGIPTKILVLSFNILKGGHDAGNVGFPNSRFKGSRFDDLGFIVAKVNPDIIGIQEDTATDSLLVTLGDGWNRCHNIYSRFKLKPLDSNGKLLNACHVYLPNGDSLVFVNAHWWPTGGYGPGIIKQKVITGNMSADPEVFEMEILNATKHIATGPRGYLATIKMIRPYLERNEKVVLVGDFNEPSHLDWTERYAREGRDRLVRNPTDTPIRFAIEWHGSKALEDLGLSDAYRTFYKDEVEKPGITWTPPYPNNTPGRQDYDNQVLERIDRIYFNQGRLRCTKAAVVTGIKGMGEIKLDIDWPSDHWAVQVEFELQKE